MKKSLKKIITSLLFTMLAIAANAQVSLETVSFRIADDCYYPVIVPTLNNLIAIVNMDVSTFKETMGKYEYHPDDSNVWSAYVYTNLNLDFFLDNNNGEGTNTIVFNPAGKNKLAGFIVFSEQAYPRTCIQDLYQQLAPYYQKTVGSKRYYALRYDGSSYGIEMIPYRDRTAAYIHKFVR